MEILSLSLFHKNVESILSERLNCVLFIGSILLRSAYLRSWKILHEHHTVTISDVCNKEVKDAVSSMVSISDPRVMPTLFAVFDYCGQFQTIAAALFRNLVPNFLVGIKFERQLVPVSDGGLISLDWAVPKDEEASKILMEDKTKPILLMCHGLCGSAESDYIIHTANNFTFRHNYRVVALVARGCGGLELKTPVGFNAARISDIAEALEVIAAKFPEAKIFGMSFSLGACIMLNYLGKHEHNVVGARTVEASPVPTKTKPLLAATVCVCPPWDFTLDYHTPVYGTWMRVLSAGLKSYFHDHHHVFEAADILIADDVYAASTVQGIDSIVANPVHGYRDMEDYYWHSSSAYAAKYIDVPTLAISAQDDPVCSIHGCPDINNLVTAYHANGGSIPDEIKQHLDVEAVNPSNIGAGLVIIKTVLGGHLGYMGAPACFFLQTDTWIDRLSLEWFEKFQ